MFFVVKPYATTIFQHIMSIFHDKQRKKHTFAESNHPVFHGFPYFSRLFPPFCPPFFSVKAMALPRCRGLFLQRGSGPTHRGARPATAVWHLKNWENDGKWRLDPYFMGKSMGKPSHWEVEMVAQYGPEIGYQQMIHCSRSVDLKPSSCGGTTIYGNPALQF